VVVPTQGLRHWATIMRPVGAETTYAAGAWEKPVSKGGRTRQKDSEFGGEGFGVSPRGGWPERREMGTVVPRNRPEIAAVGVRDSREAGVALPDDRLRWRNLLNK